MKIAFVPVFLVFAGFALLFEPLMAVGDCGLYPVPHVPASCVGAMAIPPNPIVSDCEELPDGTCMSSNCSGEAWGQALPGHCESAPITEAFVPECESNYSATSITTPLFEWRCATNKKGQCRCSARSGETIRVLTVCNCRNVPLGDDD